MHMYGGGAFSPDASADASVYEGLNCGEPSTRVPAWPVWGPTREGRCASSLIYVLAPNETKHCLTSAPPSSLSASHLSPLKPPTAADRLKRSGKMWLFTHLGHIKVWPGSFIVSRGWFSIKESAVALLVENRLHMESLKKKNSREFLLQGKQAEILKDTIVFPVLSFL